MTPDSIVTRLNDQLRPAFRAASAANADEAWPVFAALEKSVEEAFEAADNRRQSGRPDEALEHLIAELPRAIDDFGRELDARAVTDKTAQAACSRLIGSVLTASLSVMDAGLAPLSAAMQQIMISLEEAQERIEVRLGKRTGKTPLETFRADHTESLAPASRRARPVQVMNVTFSGTKLQRPQA